MGLQSVPSTAEGLAAAADTLDRGGVVAFPTERWYLLVGRGDAPGVVDRLYRAKGRSRVKPLMALASSVDDAARFVCFPDPAERLARALWPGMVALLAPAAAGAHDLPIVDSSGVALVACEGGIGLELAHTSPAPLVATSANVTGEWPALRMDEVEVLADSRRGLIDIAIEPPPECTIGQHLTVVDVSGVEPVVVRDGPVTRARIAELWAPDAPPTPAEQVGRGTMTARGGRGRRGEGSRG